MAASEDPTSRDTSTDSPNISGALNLVEFDATTIGHDGVIERIVGFFRPLGPLET